MALSVVRSSTAKPTMPQRSAFRGSHSVQHCTHWASCWLRMFQHAASNADFRSALWPPQHQPYWLAVEIFRQTGEGWTTIARREATEVPHTYELDGRDVVLEIAYS
jgi:hypothetical protein